MSAPKWNLGPRWGRWLCRLLGHRHDVEFTADGVTGVFYGCHRCGLAGYQP